MYIDKQMLPESVADASSTLLVQQLKKKLVHKIVQQGTDYHSVYSNFFLSF